MTETVKYNTEDDILLIWFSDHDIYDAQMVGSTICAWARTASRSCWKSWMRALLWATSRRRSLRPGMRATRPDPPEA